MSFPCSAEAADAGVVSVHGPETCPLMLRFTGPCTVAGTFSCVRVASVMLSQSFIAVSDSKTACLNACAAEERRSLYARCVSNLFHARTDIYIF